MKNNFKEILISFLWSTEFKVAVSVMFATGFGYIGGISGNAYTGQNNIQAAHNTVEWEKEDGTVTVSDVNRTLTTQGSSMRPTFFTGNTILTREYTGQELEEGDIIT